jgi:hypothetical protein
MDNTITDTAVATDNGYYEPETGRTIVERTITVKFLVPSAKDITAVPSVIEAFEELFLYYTPDTYNDLSSVTNRVLSEEEFNANEEAVTTTVTNAFFNTLFGGSDDGGFDALISALS